MQKPHMKHKGLGSVLRRGLPVSFAVALTLTLGTADAWAKGNEAPPLVAEAPAPTSARVPTGTPLAFPPGIVDQDLAEYARREAEAQGLETFQGGAYVVIGASGLAVALLFIL